MRQKMKGFLTACLGALALVCVTVWPVYAEDTVTYLDTDVDKASEGCTLLGLEGKYISDAQDALDRINAIRKEACKAGNVPDPRDESTYLEAGDYVEIQWSTALEKIARIRAAEASITIAHERMNGGDIFAVTYGGITTSAENLAWNNASSMVYGINQWYEEKDDWVNQTSGAVTGHYTSLINPDYTYIGLGDFRSADTYYSNTLAASFSSKSGSLGTGYLDATDNIIQKIEVDDDSITYVIDGDDTVGKTQSASYALKAQLSCAGVSGYTQLVDVLGSVTFESSDESIATITSTGELTGVEKGSTTLTAYLDGTKKAELSVEIGCPHEYTYTRSVYSYTKTCSLCDASETFTYWVGWGTASNGEFSTSRTSSQAVGASYYVWPVYQVDGSSVKTYKVNIVSSDPAVVSVDVTGYSNVQPLTFGSAGIAALTVTPVEDPTLAQTFTFRVGDDGSVDISLAEVTLSADSYTYTGSAKSPTPAVVYDGITLTRGTDYTVSYSDNTDIGKATVTITGAGLFTGSVNANFVIKPPALSDCSVAIDSTEYVYTGDEAKPNVTVSYKGTAIASSNYTIEYQNNVNVGTATVTISNPYDETDTVAMEYTISAANISGATLTLSETSYTYDGTEKQPTVAVIYNNKELTADTDYTVSYTGNTNVGTAIVTVTGMGNYTGSGTENFSITQKTVTGVEIETIAEEKYTGSEITPPVTLTDSSYNAGTDYTVAYSDNVNAGTATVTVTFKGNYTGTITGNFTIAAKALTASMVSVASEVIYTGEALTPTVTVEDGETTLEENTDYTVSYTDNTNAGTASVTVTGTGNYTGSCTVNFTITPKTVTGVSVNAIAEQTYQGTALEPAVTLSDDSYLAGTDYTVAYENNVNVGTATVTVNFTGNYTGTITGEFTINPKSIGGVTLSEIASQTYSGKALEPDITVKDGENTLTKGTDYTVAYANNTKAGTARVTVTGANNYTGTVETTFTIAPKEVEGVTVNAIADQEYQKAGCTPAIILSDDTYVKDTDYTVVYSNNVEIGTATVTVTFTGNYTGTITGTFEITQRKLTADMVSVSEPSYTGTALTPAVTVTDEGGALTEGTDYTVDSYADNTNAGTASVTVTGKGNYTGSCIVNFTIHPQAVAEVSIEDIAAETYTGSALEPTVILSNTSYVEGTDYTVAYADNVNAGTATVTVTFTGNYTGTITKEFTISPKPVENVSIDAIAEQTYQGTAITPAITLSDTSYVKDVDYTVAYADNVNAGTAAVTVTFTGNYSGEITGTFTIDPKSLSGAALSAIGNQTYTGEALTPAVTVTDGTVTLTVGTDYTLAYANNVNAGTATVTVTGKGNYTGSAETSFAIVKKEASVIEETAQETTEETRETTEETGTTEKETETISVKKIKITGISKKIAAGKKIKLKATVTPSNASNKKVTWKSSNKKVATVNSKGVVTVKKNTGGKKVTITATAKDGSGVVAKYVIRSMKGKVKKITASNLTVKAGKTAKIKVKITATAGANKTVTFTSSNKKYATVTKAGKVKALKKGKGKTVKITIQATDGTGKKKKIKVKIK